MPQPDDPASARPSRAPRRSLGRGPGTAPPQEDQPPSPRPAPAVEPPPEPEPAAAPAPGRAAEAAPAPGAGPGAGDSFPGLASSSNPGAASGPPEPSAGLRPLAGAAADVATEPEPDLAPNRGAEPAPEPGPAAAPAPGRAADAAPAPGAGPGAGDSFPGLASSSNPGAASGPPEPSAGLRPLTGAAADVATEPEPDPAPNRGAEPGPAAGGFEARLGLGPGGGAASASGRGAGGLPPVSGRGGVGEEPPPVGDGRFTVRLANFEGPFDLLLQLISKHKLDVTEVALSKVTDEFMAHIRAMGADWDLDQTTEFLVVAATLLDLKAARLLPAAEVEDEADLALLEARDLLFARLLQYRAYKQIADIFNGRLDAEGKRYPRIVGLEPHHAELLPEVVISIGAEGFAKLAVKAMQPRAKPQVYVDHIHAPLVSVREQADVVVARLREHGEASFRTLTEDAPDTLTVVARFLALLELYREKAVVLDQEEALGPLMVRWTGGDGPQPAVTDEFDQEVPRNENKNKNEEERS